MEVPRVALRLTGEVEENESASLERLARLKLPDEAGLRPALRFGQAESSKLRDAAVAGLREAEGILDLWAPDFCACHADWLSRPILLGSDARAGNG